MNANAYLDRMKNAQTIFLDYLEGNEENEKDFEISNFEYLRNFTKEEKKQELKEILYLLIQIANNHRRTPAFYSKIDQILHKFEKQIIETFTNDEIFKIFINCELILIFLIGQKIIKIDDEIVKLILRSEKQFKLFLDEITAFACQNNEVEKKNKYENDDPLCQIIRNDSIDEFTSYINQNKTSLLTKISPSIFETNSFLIGKEISIIEYAAFFGSIQIFKYLINSNVQLNSSLWIFAVHSNDIKLIKILEESKVEPEDKTFKECFIESIKCHHNNLAKYIQENLMKQKIDTFSEIIQYGNYSFFPNDFSNYFGDLIECNNFTMVKMLLSGSNIDINSNIILYLKFNSIS